MLVEDVLDLAVSDTGIGIAAADQAQIFEPFYQVESELNRRFEGTGLGLPIVRSLVELHGASISLESAPGRGTRVRVRFPAQRSEEHTSELQSLMRLSYAFFCLQKNTHL